MILDGFAIAVLRRVRQGKTAVGTESEQVITVGPAHWIVRALLMQRRKAVVTRERIQS